MMLLRITLITFMALFVISGCGPSKHQLALNKSTALIAMMQSYGVIRMLNPQEYKNINEWLATELEKDL